jgi:hypothetical protein
LRGLKAICIIGMLDIVGSLPADWATFTQLQEIRLGNNSLSGGQLLLLCSTATVPDGTSMLYSTTTRVCGVCCLHNNTGHITPGSAAVGASLA